MFFVILIVLLASVIWKIRDIARYYLATSPLDNIPGPKSPSFWAGNIGLLFDSKQGFKHHEEVSKYGPVSRISGPCGTRALYIYDPAALRSILLDNQSIFDHAPWILARNQILFGPSVFSTVGEQHRRQRRLLNPAFAAQSLKRLTPLFYEVAHQLRKGMAAELNGRAGELDILLWSARAAVEGIAHGGFGQSFNSFAKTTDVHPIGKALKDLVPALTKLNMFQPIVTYFNQMGSGAFRRRLVEMAPFENIQRMRWVVDTMVETSTGILRRKLEDLRGGDTCSTDMLSGLLRRDQKSKDDFSEEELVAQISSMLFGGADTTSNAMARILQLLAEHPDAQDKLRAELSAESETGDIPHDRLLELPYLDAICRETLRLYPPAPMALREPSADTTLPLLHPIVALDGQLMDSVPLPKGTMIMISILSCNRNEAIWGEDALEWKPERWLSPLPDTVTEARVPGVYSNLLTFLAGSRSCIGFSFSQLEMKILLSILLTAFKFAPTEHKIIWNMGAVNFPTSDIFDKSARLPLQIEIIRPS
ncbi:hypothetical protein NM688_g7759 [Phlebia brevispora]|uniref:Uncharacterized protein n=1 Tax=Phlebia brevispora TaxID=194682 RepID=A0ACC1S1D8_9APHY|nr:hypothetical protein NM688_g7759 [Phlebia brevispora]